MLSLASASVVVALPWVVTLGSAHAQEARWAAGLAAGSGLSLGGSQGGAVMGMSPVFLEASIRHWTDEQSAVIYGGGLRAELLGQVSGGGVVRVELRKDLGALELLPGVGAPFVLVPESMFGVEASLLGRIPLGDVGICVMLLVDIYLFGTDVPADSAVVMLNGTLGVDFSL